MGIDFQDRLVLASGDVDVGIVAKHFRQLNFRVQLICSVYRAKLDVLGTETEYDLFSFVVLNLLAQLLVELKSVVAIRLSGWQ